MNTGLPLCVQNPSRNATVILWPEWNVRLLVLFLGVRVCVLARLVELCARVCGPPLGVRSRVWSACGVCPCGVCGVFVCGRGNRWWVRLAPVCPLRCGAGIPCAVSVSRLWCVFGGALAVPLWCVWVQCVLWFLCGLCGVCLGLFYVCGVRVLCVRFRGCVRTGVWLCWRAPGVRVVWFVWCCVVGERWVVVVVAWRVV